MNRVLLAIIIVALIAVGAWYGISKTNTNQTSPYGKTNSSKQESQQSQAKKSPVATNTVTIQNFAFSPTDITVKKGSAVTWTNSDNVAHTVTENDGKSGPNSSELTSGQTYSFTFTETGTFHYHCSLHPEMTGTVTVTE